MISVAPFILGISLAEREGLARDDALRVGLVQGMIGLNPMGILLARNLVDNARPLPAPVVVAPVEQRPQEESSPYLDMPYQGPAEQSAEVPTVERLLTLVLDHLQQMKGDITSMDKKLKELMQDVGKVENGLAAERERINVLFDAGQASPAQRAK